MNGIDRPMNESIDNVYFPYVIICLILYPGYTQKFINHSVSSMVNEINANTMRFTSILI